MHVLTIIGIVLLGALICINRFVKPLPNWVSFVCYLAASLLVIGGMGLARQG